MGVALPLFAESLSEFVDIELYDNMSTDELKLKLEKVLPQGAEIISIVKIDKSAKSIDTTAQWAEYKISPYNSHLYDFNNLKYDTDKVLSSEEIFIEKKNKKGLLSKVNIKPSIKSYRFEDECLYVILKTGQGTEIPALRADMLMKLISGETLFSITRTRFFDEQLEEL